jgi:hypothetical protein
MVLISLALLVVVITAAGCLYWRSLRATPQYSLALLIDAARRNDKAAIGDLVDTDKVVDSFVPQIMTSAVDMYGRGLPPQTINNLAIVAQPVVPALKDRARMEVPKVIRDRTSKLDNIPFAAIVMGADRYLDIKIDGDTAEVTSKIPDRPLDLRMTRSGERWQVVGVEDKDLADNIARTVGQQIIAIASGAKIGDAGKNLGVKDLQVVLKQAEELLR